jgi:hypothetical protein
MLRDLVSTRIELDRQSDTDIRKIMRAEQRKSKREMAAVLLTRVARIWAERPEALREAGVILDR